MRSLELHIIVPVPDDMTTGQIKRYVLEALRQWRKGGDPESSLFLANDRRFKIVNTPKEVPQ